MKEALLAPRRSRLFQLSLLAIAVGAAAYTRVVLGPLQESIKESMSLSDNRIALLQGMGVAVPAALGAVPLGLLADRVARARMMLVFIALAFISCVLSAFASGFDRLLATRVLAALSGTAVAVAAYSMVGDLFAPTERGRATMVMGIGELGGAPTAFAVGGLVLVMVASSPSMGTWRIDAWRISLVWMGGLLVPVFLLLLFLREPGRGERIVATPSLRTVWPELWRYRGMALPLQLGRATLFIADGSVYVWGAPLFTRKYHLPPDRTGAIMGMVLLVSGLLGPALGGLLVDLCQRRGGPRSVVTVMAGASLVSVCPALFALMPDATLASFSLATFLTLGFTTGAAALALSIIVIPGELRGLNLGVSILVGSLFFAGLAPLTVSELSSVLGGEPLIGKALAIVCVTMSVLTAVILIIGRKHFPKLPPKVANERREPKGESCAATLVK